MGRPIWWPPPTGGGGPGPAPAQTGPLIDVSDILLDTDFVSNLNLIHRTEVVNSYGKTELTEDLVQTVGSVQPLPQKDIMRLPEAMRIKDVRGFWIKAPILSDGTAQYPDIISFGGKRFEVISVEPWLNWGGGWNKGICVQAEPAG